MKILITGFEPFGESSINPSQMLVESLSDDGYDNHVLIKATLPVDQANAPGKLKMLINQHQPEAILGTQSSRLPDPRQPGRHDHRPAHSPQWASRLLFNPAHPKNVCQPL